MATIVRVQEKLQLVKAERSRLKKERNVLRKRLANDAATARDRVEELDSEVQRLTEELTTQQGATERLDSEVKRLHEQLATEWSKFETATKERALQAELAQLRAVEAVRAEVRDREARAKTTILELRKQLEVSKTPPCPERFPLDVHGDVDHGEQTAGESDSVASRTSQSAKDKAMFVAQQHIPDIGRFSGAEATDGETVEDWVEQLEMIAAAFKWDEQTTLVHLTTQLTGAALAFFRSCSSEQKRSYSLLRAKLLERFTPVHIKSVQSGLFHERVQQSSESVDSYTRKS